MFNNPSHLGGFFGGDPYDHSMETMRFYGFKDANDFGFSQQRNLNPQIDTSTRLQAMDERFGSGETLAVGIHLRVSSWDKLCVDDADGFVTMRRRKEKA